MFVDYRKFRLGLQIIKVQGVYDNRSVIINLLLKFKFLSVLSTIYPQSTKGYSGKIVFISYIHILFIDIILLNCLFLLLNCIKNSLNVGHKF